MHHQPAYRIPCNPRPAATVDLLEAVSESTALAYLDRFKAPRWLFRTAACLVLGGQVMARLFRGAYGGQARRAARVAAGNRK